MQNTNILNSDRVKTVLIFAIITSCLFFSACTALQEAQQRREARRLEKRKQADFVRNPFIEVTDATFDSLVLKSELPVVVAFGADW